MITSRIKTGYYKTLGIRYYLKLLTPETMKLSGRNKSYKN